MRPQLFIISTSRLILRAPSQSDVDSCVARWTDDRVMEHMGGPRNPDDLRAAFIESLKPEHQCDDQWWTIVAAASDQPIGDIGLIQKTVDGKSETELVYILDHDQWGQGFASEAASALLQHAYSAGGYARIVSLIHENHIASQRVAIKAGMSCHKKTVRPGEGEDGRVMLVFVSERSAG